MITKAVFLFLGTQALIQAAASSAPQGLPSSFPDPLHFVLERLVNPKQRSIIGDMLDEGGTHNLIHYACIDNQHAAAGFLPSSAGTPLEKTIGTHISDDKNQPGHTFSVGKKRFALFHEQGARNIVLRTFAKGSIDEFEDREIFVEGLPDPAYGEQPIVLSISHGAIFKCWAARAGLGKTLNAQPTQTVVLHATPMGSQPFPYSMGMAPSAPSY